MAGPHADTDVSMSGSGSSLEKTRAIRAALPPLIRELECASMLDIPCGDFFWMKELDLDVEYVGADIVTEVVEANQRLHGRARRRFVRLDLTRDDLPRTDLILCRDCLVHLSFSDIFKALAGIRRSGSTWLLTTTFSGTGGNVDIPTGSWRPLNLERPPFGFPPPVRSLPEEGDKSLSLWRIADILQRSTARR